MKKWVSILVVGSLVLALAGCMGKPDQSGERVVLKIGLPSGNAVTPMEIVDDFKEKNPQIEVEIDETPWSDFKTKLKMQISTGNAPTVFLMDSGYVAALGKMGASVDLTDRVKKEINTDDYIDALFAGVDGEGHLWGIPHGLNAVGVYYNKTLFDEAGIAYPETNWTFDDMFEIAKKLTRENGGAVEQYGLSYDTSITTGWLPFITAAGGAPVDETRTKSMFKDEKTVLGIEKYLQPFKLGIAPDTDWIASSGGNLAAFYTGKLGMLIAQSSVAKAINTNAPNDFMYDAQMLPIGWDGKRHSVYVPNQWTIYSRASEAEKEAAWEWIKYFISEEAQMKVAETFLSGYPAKKSALDYLRTKETVPANMKVFYEGIAESGVTLFENRTWEEWRILPDKYITQIRNGEIDFEEGINTLDAEVAKVLEGE